jgi:hypothetical protein
MRWTFRIPRFFASTVEAGPSPSLAILDGNPGIVPNVWKLPAQTVALIGRPAVWFGFDIRTLRIPLGFTTIPPLRLVWEQDVGGHLFILVTDEDPTNVALFEGGPVNPNGTGALVPFCYPEDHFAQRGIVDFDPVVIAPPNGLSQTFFAELVRVTQRDYDGDQRYLAVEMPFLRIGRDSNSYAIGILLACGIDERSIPKPVKEWRFEWVGYPGARDPVHRANFGAYLGAPKDLGDGVLEVAYHNGDGSVRLVGIGGKPGATVRLPDGAEYSLDALGRLMLSPDDAQRHGLPSNMTAPPDQIRNRRRFPSDPNPSGAEITLVVDGRSVPLVPGTEYRGTIVARNDALLLATLRTATGSEVVLPLVELGVELRDPKRVDALLRVGNELTVGLHGDRRPKLIAHGAAGVDDTLAWHEFHAPPWRNVFFTSALGVGAVTLVALLLLRRR